MHFLSLTILLRLAFGTNSEGKVFSDLPNFADDYYHPFVKWAEKNIFGQLKLSVIRCISSDVHS